MCRKFIKAFIFMIDAKILETDSIFGEEFPAVVDSDVFATKNCIVKWSMAVNAVAADRDHT